MVYFEYPILYKTSTTMDILNFIYDFMFRSPEGVQLANPALLAPIVLQLLGQGAKMIADRSAANRQAQAINQYKGDMQGRINDLSAWYEGEMNTSILDTPLGVAMLSRLQQNQKDNIDRVEGSAARTGGTAESRVAAQGEMSDAFAKALSDMTAMGTQRRDNLRQQYDWRLSNLRQPLDKMNMMQIQGYDTARQNNQGALNSFSSMLGNMNWSEIMGGSKKT